MQRSALFSEMRIGDVVIVQLRRRDAERPGEQLQRIEFFDVEKFTIGQRMWRRSALVSGAVTGRGGLGVVGGRAEWREAKAGGIAMCAQEIGKIGGAVRGALGPFETNDDQAFDGVVGEVESRRIALLCKRVHIVLRDFQCHAIGERGSEVHHPGAVATEQRFGVVVGQPIGRQQQFIRNAIAPLTKYFPSACGITDRAPTIGQQDGARRFRQRVDRVGGGKLRCVRAITVRDRIEWRKHAHDPCSAATAERHGEIAQHACSFIVFVCKTRVPIIGAGAQFGRRQCGHMIDGVDVVRIHTNAQTIDVARCEVARFDAHR